MQLSGNPDPPLRHLVGIRLAQNLCPNMPFPGQIPYQLAYGLFRQPIELGEIPVAGPAISLSGRHGPNFAIQQLGVGPQRLIVTHRRRNHRVKAGLVSALPFPCSVHSFPLFVFFSCFLVENVI